METKEWTSVDKTDWGDGPWQHEPDKRQWQDPATGLPCLMHRNHVGGWCGYVGVPNGHRFYEADYDDVPDVWVHGGLTYANKCSPDATPEDGICHIVQDGEDDDVWWLGFDCVHGGDYAPEMEASLAKHRLPAVSVMGDHYWTVAEVEAEVTELARQLA